MPVLAAVTMIRGVMAGLSAAAWCGIGLLVGGLLMLIASVLYYDGGPSFRVPLYGMVNIPPEGKVERVLREARAQCQAEKKASQEAAERFDLEQQRDAAERHVEDLRAANERTLAAQQDLITFQETVNEEIKQQQEEADAADKATGGQVRTRIVCNAGPRTAAGLQRRNLPYPDALLPRDQ